MTIRSAFGDDDGIIYVVNAAGDLLWYRHMRRSGDAAWDPRSGAMIGNGWGDFAHLVTGGNGVIYAVKPTGELLWYKRTARDADPRSWEPNSGVQIGSGWASFERVFSGGGGVLYAIDAEGRLWWGEHLAFSGTPQWANGIALQVGEGWSGLINVFSGGQGVIYAVTQTGDLLWYRHMSRFADPLFMSEGQPINAPGVRWNTFKYVFSGGNGVIYGITASGELMWHEHLSRIGKPEWANDGVSRSIKSGWNLRAPLEGYCTPLSVAPGERIDFHLSSDQANVSVEYFRLKQQADGGFGAAVASGRVPADVQAKPIATDAYETGCNWSSDLSLSIPADWRSGLYTARFKNDAGNAYDVVFNVKPGVARGDFAVLANTHTWTAYNDWCDRSQYTNPNAAVLSMQRPNPSTSPVDDDQLNHLTRAELWVLNWLEDSGYRFDVYSDVDFHEGIDALHGYKALILHTHPEYWTSAMRDHLDSFLGAGGRLLYLAGNGLYEEVEYADNRLTLRGGDFRQPRDPFYFRNRMPPRPERSVLGVAYEIDNWSADKSQYAPLVVKVEDHRFFNGTHLRNGQTFGENGRNGAASGWEMDSSRPSSGAPGGAPANVQVLAEGTNTGPSNNFAAQVTYYDTPSGGFVFSAGSLTFGGSLAVDPAIQKIVRNVLDECISRNAERTPT